MNKHTGERISWRPTIPASRRRGELPPPPHGTHVDVANANPHAATATAPPPPMATVPYLPQANPHAMASPHGDDEAYARRLQEQELQSPLLDDNSRKVAKLKTLRDRGIITQEEFMHQTSLLYETAAPLARPARPSQDDEAYARRLQEEENNRARAASTRGRGGRRAPMARAAGLTPNNYGSTASTVVVMQSEAPAYVPDHCCLSWFVFCCCCWPIGIWALCESSNVQSALARGDTKAARSHSESAYCANTWGVSCGLILIITGVILRLAVLQQ